MKKFLFLALMPVFALAQTSVTARLNWTAPTVHTDNSPISGALTYNVYQGAKGATKPKVSSAIVGVSTQLTAAPGACFQVSAVEGNIESSLSSEACLPLPPNAPSGVTVTVVVTVTTP